MWFDWRDEDFQSLSVVSFCLCKVKIFVLSIFNRRYICNAYVSDMTQHQNAIHYTHKIMESNFTYTYACICVCAQILIEISILKQQRTTELKFQCRAKELKYTTFVGLKRRGWKITLCSICLTKAVQRIDGVPCPWLQLHYCYYSVVCVSYAILLYSQNYLSSALHSPESF